MQLPLRTVNLLSCSTEKAVLENRPLLEAGVLPRLEQEHAVHFLRRERKLGISIALARAFNTLGDSEAIKSAWHETEQRTDQPLTIIMDQVEEIYTRPMEETYPGDTENLHTPTELSTFLDVLSTVFFQAR